MFMSIRKYMRALTALLLSGVVLFNASAGISDNTPSDKSREDEKPLREGSAWTLSFPLGLHQQSTIDTLSYNYQRICIPAMVSDAYATTGNLGAEGLNLIYFNRPATEDFFFLNSLKHYVPSFDTQKFYNVYIPTSILSYNFGGSSANHQDLLTLDFAGNVNRNIGVGTSLSYLHSKGSYADQAAKHFNYSLSAYYTGARYEMQMFYNHYNSVNKENGGITNDLYITDPAVLQGGVSQIEPKSIPVRLSNAHSRVNGQQLFMTHAYKVGFWREEQVNDTLRRDVYVPVTKFIYSLDLKTAKHNFNHQGRSSTDGSPFWENTYLTPNGSNDFTNYLSLTNSFGIYMIEGFRDWAKFGLSAFVSYSLDRFKQTTAYELPVLDETQLSQLTPLPDGFAIEPIHTQHKLRVGGRIEKTRGSILRYNAQALFGLSDDAAGDIDINGNIDTHIPLFGDTVVIGGFGRFANLAPSWLLKHYISNHFAWNNNFGKTRTFRVGGHLLIPWTSTHFTAGVENVQNQIYFDSSSLPRQHSGNVQIFSATLNQNFRFGIWNWNNSITFQTSSDNQVIPLPKLSVYSNMFLKFIAFKVLKLQIGIDCDYYTAYKGHDYQPATMTFINQQSTPVGNFALCNAYITARLYRTRFYLLYSHVNQGWFGKNYFSLPHYPINPRRFQLGISIDFAD